MEQIRLIIHDKLKYFIDPKWKNQSIEVVFSGKVTLKHILESLGIPHPEVGVVKIGERNLGLSYYVQNEDIIEVFPFDPNLTHIMPEKARFILDNNLGKLNDYLRLLGFDALYNHNWSDQLLAEQASSQDRILLTRDRGLLKRKIVNLGYCVRSDLPRDQVEEVIHHFGLERYINPYNRCVRCNGLLQQVEKQEIIDKLLPLTRLYYDEFTRCTDCGQIYWKGSHYDHMQEFMQKFHKDDPQEG